MKTWAYLGLHLAKKIKGAISLQTYKIKGGKRNKQKAVEYLENALAYRDKVIEITRPIYKDMALTPYTRNGDILFHWEHIRPEVKRDIEIAKNASVVTEVKESKKK